MTALSVLVIFCGILLVGMYDVSAFVGGVIGLALVLAIEFARRRGPKMRFLRRSLYDSFYMKHRDQEPVVRPWRSVFCRHRIVHEFCRTDSREGSGWMSDSYEGSVCAACGRITTERKVY